MKIDLSGHHVDITTGIREAIEHKFKKIGTHYPDVSSLTILLTVERNSQTVDVKTQFLGAPITVKASDHDMYAAIADAVKKLDSALSSRKGGIKAGLHSKPELNQSEDD